MKRLLSEAAFIMRFDISKLHRRINLSPALDAGVLVRRFLVNQ